MKKITYRFRSIGRVRVCSFCSVFCCTFTVLWMQTYRPKQTKVQLAARKNALESSGLSSGRWGFKGSEDLGSGKKANFNFESSLAVDTGVAGSLFDRRATVGLSGSFGAFDAGRQTNLVYDTLSQIDPTSFAHLCTNPNVNLGSLNNATLYNTHGSSNGVSSAARENNSIKYSAPAMFGSVVSQVCTVSVKNW